MNSAITVACTSQIPAEFPGERSTDLVGDSLLSTHLDTSNHYVNAADQVSCSFREYTPRHTMLPHIATRRPRAFKIKQPSRTGPQSHGLAQLSLIEHALCPLDKNVSLRDGSHYHTGFYYGSSGDRRFANVAVSAARGLSPNDELFLWGLLALALAEDDGSVEFWATPYHCLRRLGYTESYRSQGGTQYQLFHDAVLRLSHVVYWCDAFYNPVRREHLERTMGFLKYERPLDPHSSRQCRFVWDPLFLEFCRATGGGRLFFDLDVYRGLDFASRRLFLLLHKLFGGKQHRTSPTFDIRHLAVHSLGFAAHLSVKTLKQKLSRVIERMIDIGAIALPAPMQHIDDLFTRKAKGLYTVTFPAGPYFTTPTMARRPSNRPSITDSALYDPLHVIGFADEEVARIIRSFPKGKIQVWSDVTLRAMEGARGFPGFKKDPKAFFLYHVKQAKENNLTPPDWWRVACKEEERRRLELERPPAESIAVDREAAWWQARKMALTEYTSNHADEFERLVEIFVQLHSGKMPLEDAYRAAQTDARTQLEGRFHFPDQDEWIAEHFSLVTTGPDSHR